MPKGTESDPVLGNPSGCCFQTRLQRGEGRIGDTSEEMTPPAILHIQIPRTTNVVINIILDHQQHLTKPTIFIIPTSKIKKQTQRS